MSIKEFAYTHCPHILRSYFDKTIDSPIGFRLARGIFWSIFGTVISRILFLGATALVARILGTSIYGELGMIQSTVGMVSVFAGFGLGLTAIKYVAEFRQNDPDRTGRIIGLSRLVAMVSGSLMALALLIFAPILADSIINAPHLLVALRISAMMIFINSLTGAQTGALAGFEAFKSIAFVNFIVGIISFPILVWGAYLGGLRGAVLALTFNSGINWLFNYFALRKETSRYKVPFTFLGFRQELSILLIFSLPAVLSDLLVAPVKWLCNALLVNQPSGYSSMGLFTAVLTFQGLLLFAGKMLNSPLLSMISNKESKKSNKINIVNILSSWILGVFFAIPLLCFPEIAKMIFGKNYYSYNFKVTFSIIIFCTCIMMFKQGLTRIVIASNLLWWGFFSNTIWGIILIPSAFFFVRLGAFGLAISYFIAYIIQTLIVLPILASRKLIPSKVLFSNESFIIWFMLISLVLMNIANISFIFRSITFVPCLLIVGISFRKTFKRTIIASRK